MDRCAVSREKLADLADTTGSAVWLSGQLDGQLSVALLPAGIFRLGTIAVRFQTPRSWLRLLRALSRLIM